MPWLVVVWTIVTLCFEVCHVSISTNCSVQNTLARNVTNHRRYAHVTPFLKQLHWLTVKYRYMFKLQHWFTNFYIVILLPELNCSYFSTVVPIVPGVVTLIINTLQYYNLP